MGLRWRNVFDISADIFLANHLFELLNILGIKLVGFGFFFEGDHQGGVFLVGLEQFI